MDNPKFENIGGYEYPKLEAAKIANFFKNYKFYRENGARLPKGIVFYGDPGTGKTLFAKAIANEAGVNMYPLTTDEFYKESNISTSIKGVFEMAKQNAPSIILIDELDRLVNCEVGYKKQESDKQREALRCLLTEIDNIADADVLVIATANTKVANIPAALVRNGRIEKHIEIGIPTKSDREAILSIYLNKNSIFKNIEVKDVASYTAKFTAASLEALVNDVLINCITDNKIATFNDFLEPIEVIRTCGIKSKIENDNTPVIYHELGHFICDYVLNDKVGMINVVPHGESQGRYTMISQTDADVLKDSYSKCKKTCVSLVAGLVATEVFMGEPHLGSSSDLEKVTSNYITMVKSGMFSSTETAIYMLTQTGYDSCFIDTNSHLSGHFAKFIEECKEEARRIITNNKHIAEALFKELKEKSVLTHKEIEEIIKDIPVIK